MLLGESRNQSAANHKFHAEQEKYWHDSLGSISAKLQNFTKYVRREDLTKFLARNEIFVRQLYVHGSVVDIGVGRGASLMTWLHLSSIYEPSNYTRKVVGFDTFAGLFARSLDATRTLRYVSLKSWRLSPQPTTVFLSSLTSSNARQRGSVRHGS